MNISDRGLTSLAQAFGELDMGTETEVQLGIITPLSLAGKLPVPAAFFHALFDKIQKDIANIASARRDQKWHDLGVTLEKLNHNVRRRGDHKTRIIANAIPFFATHHKLHQDERELRKLLFPEWNRLQKKYDDLLTKFKEWTKDQLGDLKNVQDLHATTARLSGESGNNTTGGAAYPSSHRLNTSELKWLSIGGDADDVGGLEKMQEACKRTNCREPDMYGWTPLHYAIAISNAPAVGMLLERGADMRQTDLMGYTALHYPRHFLAEAISQSRDTLRDEKPSEAMELLWDVQSCLSTQGVDGQTPMHRAAESGEVSFVLELIKLFKPEDRDDIFDKTMKEDHLGHTPLHKAALYGQAEALRELAENKTDNVDKPDAHDWSLLHLAMVHDRVTDRGGTVEAILQLSPKVDHKNGGGETALIVACRRDRWDAANLLMAAGASVTMTDKNGLTALHQAATRSESRTTMMELLDRGAELEATDRYGQTPLHLAAARGSERTVKTLLERGANINAVTKKGRTPLHEAMPKRPVAVVRTLIDAGANVNALADGSITPLHCAADKGKLSVVELLLASKANAYARTDSGDMPYDLAMRKLKKTIAELLPSKPARATAAWDLD